MKLTTLVMVVLVLLIGACSSAPPVPEDRYYRLPDPNPAAQIPLLKEGSIFVERFLADGIYQDRAIAYSKQSSPDVVLQHHYSFWLDSPSKMLQVQLETYLRKEHAAALVTDVPWAHAGLSIYGRIRRLDRVLGPGSAEVRVALEFNVRQGGRDEPLLVKEYKASAKAADRSVQSSVAAFGTALSDIYSRLVKDIRGRLDQASG